MVVKRGRPGFEGPMVRIRRNETRLDLSAMNIDDYSFIYSWLKAAKDRKTRVNVLNLFDNNVTSITCGDLIELQKVMPTLETINLKGNPLSSDSKRVIQNFCLSYLYGPNIKL